ncbi:uncharacterized protein PITG_21212 [Phytophthora infestans T30-4]|uniref:PX domain-containing protein n=1 Tax=Phytophthora infestans (strain T30-4) TaxID=403677 RepID=D0P3L7_PHYIT|nr:uncharacterized protein PITG_21212 [Phytophthora infestans T30-4]EEY60262.1 conserved hypothetical protein [Phytophthora infestans T30-4]|eukprot:XP_002895109.1 conserved hypothetical protein [Phytophthora infestans T30-4]
MSDVVMHLGGFAWQATDKSESNPDRRIKLATDTTRSPKVPLRQRSLGAMPGIARYRSDSAATEPRLSICSTSGTVYESVVVVGHMYGSDKVVYYLLEVRSWEMPLEGYVVRRRYNDFFKFHQELTECMPSQRRRSSTSLGFGYSSLLCNPLTSATPESSPLWSPVRTDDGRSDQRRGSWISEDSSISQPQVEDNDTRSSASTTLTGVSSYNNDSEKPGTQTQTYTNLSEYAPIDIPLNVERYARRRAMSIGKRQLRDQASSPVPSGCNWTAEDELEALQISYETMRDQTESTSSK